MGSVEISYVVSGPENGVLPGTGGKGPQESSDPGS